MLMGAGYRPKGRYAPRAALSAFARYARPFFVNLNTNPPTQAPRLQKSHKSFPPFSHAMDGQDYRESNGLPKHICTPEMLSETKIVAALLMLYHALVEQPSISSMMNLPAPRSFR